MTMPQFELHQPRSEEEALDLLSLHSPDVRLLGGGTNLVPRLRDGALAVGHLISTKRVAGLGKINYMDEDGLVIGASATAAAVAAHEDVQRLYPALAYACLTMAAPQVCNMATVAGDLATASSGTDLAPALLAHGASVVLVERGGRRQVDLTQFFQAPGVTCAEPTEMIEAIRVPAPPRRSGSCHLRLGPAGDAVAVVAAWLSLDSGGRVIGSRVAMGAASPTPVRCVEAESILQGQGPDPRVFGMAAAAVVRACRPQDDDPALANQRRAAVHALTRLSLEQAAEIAQKTD